MALYLSGLAAGAGAGLRGRAGGLGTGLAGLALAAGGRFTSGAAGLSLRALLPYNRCRIYVFALL